MGRAGAAWENAGMDSDIDTAGEPVITCANCAACCCRLEVMLFGGDDVPSHLIAEDAWGGAVMRRLADGWCAALDRNTMLCSIYQRRPEICREFAMGDSACIEERLAYVAASALP